MASARSVGQTAMENATAGLGLGCSRFGSITSPMDFRGAEALVQSALTLGVTDFDTADIYGQGDSERWLGRILRGRDDVRIATKAGQRFSSKMALVRPFKPLLKPLLQRAASRQVQAIRARPLDLCFEPSYLRAHAEASLRRLGRERLDVFYLHNATAAAMSAGEAIACLADMKARGDIRRVGVSTDEEVAARLALADPRVEVMQLSLQMLDTAPDLAGLAAAAGIGLVVREVVGAAAGVGSATDVAERLRRASAFPAVETVLIGTSRPDRLAEAVRALAR